MGKSDILGKNVMQQSEYFADAFNYLLFQGKMMIYPHDLEELDPTELAVVRQGMRNGVFAQRYRDVLKGAVIRKDERAVYVILGIENQNDIHYAMPVKNMLYDALRYAKQVEKAGKYHRKLYKKIPSLRRGVSSAEFLSGWEKSDRLVPIFTLTIHYGAERWDGSMSLHEMFDEAVDSALLRHVPDYRINLISPQNIGDFELFHTDFGKLMKFISVSNDKQALAELIANEHEKFSSVDNDIVRAINYYTDSDIAIEDGKEETNLCKALKEYAEDYAKEIEQEVREKERIIAEKDAEIERLKAELAKSV